MQLANSDIENYDRIRAGGAGFIELPRGLIAVWGKEAVQFLDGMITNDVKTLSDGAEMLAAFPNAQGRLLALARVLRQDDRLLLETEDATREKLYNNLFRFTYAGDFFVEDLSERYRYFESFGETPLLSGGLGGVTFRSHGIPGCFIPAGAEDEFTSGDLREAVSVASDLYETLRIESGLPKYGVDMDENTIVPELGLERMISYTRGCYIGQEIIARIHFRGHVAKRLTGLMSGPGAAAASFVPGADLVSPEGKNAGRLTSVTYSPKLDKAVALGFVRYEFLAEGTELKSGNVAAAVHNLPFV